MEKQLKYILGGLILVLLFGGETTAQATGEFFIGGQYSRPYSLTRETHFGAEDKTGLFANPGGGFTFELNSRKMFGVGGLFSTSFFGMNRDAFAQYLRAESVDYIGGINSTQIGVGPVANLPIIDGIVYFQLKSYVGIRFIGTPDFVAHYLPTENRFTEVEYNTPARASTFYQLDGALQFFPSESFGFSFGLGYLGGTVSTIRYNYITDGSKIIEGSDKINQSIHYLNYRIGLVLTY